MVRTARNSGFSLLELLVVMGIFSFVLVGASQMLTSVLRDFKQTSEITMSNIEGIVGLELLKRDVENAGYGLFWDWQGGAQMAYTEAPGTNAAAASLNDIAAGPTYKAPRAIALAGGAGWKGSDRLAVKSVNVTMSERTDRWTYLKADNMPNSWTSAAGDENLVGTDWVVVISPEKVGDKGSRVLVPTNDSKFTALFQPGASVFNSRRQAYSFMYVIDPAQSAANPPKRPFNRADFYVEAPATLPQNCAPGTGILYKAVLSQSTGDFSPLAILDCVADMQVAVTSDDNGDGTSFPIHQGAAGDAMTAWNAEQARRIREVHIFILAQEGMRDRSYTHPNAVMRVGTTDAGGGLGEGRDFDFAANGVTDWMRYRWKLYTLVIKPLNLK